MRILRVFTSKKTQLICAGSGAVAGAVVWTGPLFSTPPQELQGVLLGFIVALCGVSTLGQVSARNPFRLREPDLDNPLIVASDYCRIDLAVLVFCGLGLAAAGDVLRGLFASNHNLAIVQRHTTAPTEFGGSVRVLNMNVLHGYPDFNEQEARYERTLAAFRDLEPDVLVLQEVWATREHGQLADRLANELDMNVAYARANGSLRFLGFEEGSAVLSRYPIESAERIILRPRVPVWETRIAVVVRLNMGGASPLTVVSMHLSDKNLAIARDQAQYLASRVPDADVIAGDFNAGSDTEALRVFSEEGWRDTVPGGIDHILVGEHPSSAWRIRQADWMLHPEPARMTSEPTFAISDHPAILVDLERTDVSVHSNQPKSRPAIEIAGAF